VFVSVQQQCLTSVAHLQLEFCKSSQDLFKHPTNKNHHN